MVRATLISFAAVLCLWSGSVSAGLDEGMAAYERGDYETALKEWQPLAERGNSVAAIRIGRMVWSNRIAPKDVRKIAGWLVKIAKNGTPADKREVGELFLNRSSPLHDRQLAIYWLHEAALEGDAESQAIIGGIYGFRKSVKSNITIAIGYYRAAAEQGHARAQAILGINYFSGEGVREDHEESLKWALKSANQDYPFGQRIVINRYEIEKSQVRDLVKAMKWYMILTREGGPADISLLESDNCLFLIEGTQGRNALMKKLSPDEIASARKMADVWLKDKAPDKGSMSTPIQDNVSDVPCKSLLKR